MSASEPVRSKKYAARREAILQAAAPILDRGGVRGLTLADVAASVSVAPSAISYYFDSREALAAACLRLSIAARRNLVAGAAEEATLRGRLEKLVRRHFELSRQIMQGEVSLVARFDDIKGLADESVIADYNELFRSARNLFVVDGQVPLARETLNARVHLLLQVLVFSQIWLVGYSDFERAADRTIDILLNGLGSTKRDWASVPALTLTAGQSEGNDSRETFLQVATRLISEHGYRGASVEKIVAELGVTKGALYHVIDTKDDLVEICFERTVELITKAQIASNALASDARTRLESCLRHLVDHQLGGDVPLLRYSTASLPPEVKAKVELGNVRNVNYFGSAICDGIADGSIRAVDALVAAQLVMTVIWSSTELANWLPKPLSAGATGNLVQPLFEGLLA